MDASSSTPRQLADPLARVLEWGIALFVFLAPAPLGAVGPSGRLALEIAAGVLLFVWCGRAMFRTTVLPAPLALLGALGLLGLSLAQSTPLGTAFVSFVSPDSTRIRSASDPPEAARIAETRLLGVEPDRLRSPETISVDPGATASALRTGAALVALFLVSTSVAAVCGARRLALALLVAAAFQGLYGLLVLASDSPHLWHLPKTSYLDSATGTFVNRNHFACFLAMALCSGLALILDNARRLRSTGRGSLDLFRGDGSRNLLLGLLLLIGLAGLLTSFSRAGITLGLLALLLTLVAAGRFHGVRARLVVALLVVAAALVPLIQIGSERLVERYLDSAEDLVAAGGRATVWNDTLSLAAAFPVAGAGFGTFRAVYPVYRSPEVRLFYAHAHNDLLQAVSEGGIAGVVLLALLLVAVLRTVARAIAGGHGVLALGCAAGLIAILLHSLIDFNFRIPANAATAAILAGTLQGLTRSLPAES